MREVLEIARRGRRNEHLSNKRMSKENTYKMVDLFAGCGGLSLGMEQAKG